MANELQLYADSGVYSGKTIIAKLFLAGVQFGADISTTEVIGTGHFLGDMPAVVENKYAVIFYESGNIIGQGEILWDGASEFEISIIQTNTVEMQTKLDRILGLTQENQYMDQTVYTTYQGIKLLTSGRVRVYSDASSVGTGSNVIAVYNITTVWNGDEMVSYKVVKV